MNQEEKDKLSLQIADGMMGGLVDKGAMAELIRGLCEEYNEGKQGRVPPCRAHDLEQGE